MKNFTLTLVSLFLAVQVSAQNYKKVEPYIESITKFEKFAAKAVDDYSISIYQDTRKSGVRETLLEKLKENKIILSNHKFSVNNDASYTEGLIDFLDLLTEYFEKNVGEFNINQDANAISYEELENKFKIYNEHADKIENEFMALIQLKESFSQRHGLPIKIEYSREVYKNQFFRYCGRFIEIVAKIDFADIKLQNAITSKNTDEMNIHYNQLQDYLVQGKLAIEKLGSFNKNDRMLLQVDSYINSYLKYQKNNKNKIDLIQKFVELKTYATTNNADEYYNLQVEKYNADRKTLVEQEALLINDKSNLVVTYNKQLDEFQREHLEQLILNELKIKNSLSSKENLSVVSKN